MIIQCEQCNTKFRLDDSKVTDKGVKVRCAKCKHVFTVRSERPPVEEQADFGAMLEQSTAAAASVPPPSASPPEPEPSFDMPDFGQSADADKTVMFGAAGDAPPSEQSPSFSLDMPEPEPSASFDASMFEPEAEADKTVMFTAGASAVPATDSFAMPDDQFNMSDLEGDNAFATAGAPPAASSDEMDFGSFDFGADAQEADRTVIAPPQAVSVEKAQPAQPPAASAAVPEESFDFGDNLFGEAVAPAPVEEPADAIKFDFQMDDFADSMGVESATSSPSATGAFAAAAADEPFSLGEIDFGDELTSVAVQQVNPDELKPAQDLFFAPIGDVPAKEAENHGEGTLKPSSAALPTTAAPDEELPPLSITSRRKQSPLLTGLAATLGVVVVAVLGYFGYGMLAGDKDRAPQAVAGKISIRGVAAAFVKNKAVGELLVISGEAVNEFKEPRASIQVKGVVFGANGQTLANKTAYCGNPLTKEQLAALPLDKIEAAMANQFGDSLANLEVAPAKAIPFVVVIANPPAAAKDFGVEVAGSTVATGKQQ